MRTLLLLAASLVFVFSTSTTGSKPRVRTSNGIVEGVRIAKSPWKINGYFGIPFAEPPVRFEKPVAKRNWTGVLSATRQPARCSQQATFGPVNDSEDCLYLNVFAPAKRTKGGLPVFVIVHGGSFAFGGADEGTPEHIAKNLVAKGLVVVAIQYRLGPLGFCTTKDAVMPGNYGMWDVKMAFEWIRDNIGAFGGNPNSITAYGGSAGAMLIEAMHLSPLTTNLFHKMAIFSGAVNAMFDGPTKENCEAQAASLGLNWTDSTSFKSALLGTDVNGLKVGLPAVQEKDFDYLFTEYAPVIDGDFFPASAPEMRAASQPKPTIFGIAFLEAAIFTFGLNMDSSTVEKIVDYVVPPGITNRSQFHAYFVEQYRNQGAILEPTAVDKHAAQAAFGDRFAALMDATVRRNFELFGANQTAYRYVFKHFNPAQIGPNYPFVSYASHSFDQYYSRGLPGFTFAGSDQRVADIYTTALANFAKTGNPNGSGKSALPVEWKPSTPAKPSLNYVIEATPFMDAQFFEGRPQLNNIFNKQAGTFRPV